MLPLTVGPGSASAVRVGASGRLVSPGAPVGGGAEAIRGAGQVLDTYNLLGGDHAYGTLANHAFFEERNASGQHPASELVARMARPENGGRYTKDEFAIDFEAVALTCPEGHRIGRTRWATRAGQRGWSFEFPAQVCSACPSREQCVSDKAQGKGRSVFVVPDQERLIRRHLARREEDDFQQRLAERPHVERVIAGYAQYRDIPWGRCRSGGAQVGPDEVRPG